MWFKKGSTLISAEGGVGAPMTQLDHVEHHVLIGSEICALSWYTQNFFGSYRKSPPFSPELDLRRCVSGTTSNITGFLRK